MEGGPGAASLGLQQRGQRARRGDWACFTGQEALAGVSDLPKQAPPQPHTSWEAWAGPCCPHVLWWGKGSPQCLRAQPGWWRGSRGSQPPAGSQGWSGREARSSAWALGLTDDPGPSRAAGQRGRARWRAGPSNAYSFLHHRQSIHRVSGPHPHPAEGLSYQPFVPAPSTICWGGSGESWVRRPRGPLDPAVSGPQARMGVGKLDPGTKWGPGSTRNTLVSCS